MHPRAGFHAAVFRRDRDMVSRRTILTAGAVAAAGTLTGCTAASGKEPEFVGSSMSARPSANPSPSEPKPDVIGDGSTSYTGPQPHQPVPRRLNPGEAPPQFVVF